jgi:hypothetical protein
VANRGIPTEYYLFEGRLYIFPPPSQSLDFQIHYHQQVTDLVNPADTPITPTDLDEAILSSTLVKLHTRVKEFLEADQYNTLLADQLEDAENNEAFQMENVQERVERDDTWL